MNSEINFSAKTLARCALLAALSIIFGKYLKIPIGDSLRISFENLPLFIAGFSMGPFVGAAVGVVSDLVGCLVYGYAINPIITLGAFMNGFLAGFFSHYLFTKKDYISVFSTSIITHIVGSMFFKTIGLSVWYQTPFAILIWRVPIYICTAIVEAYLIFLLYKHPATRKILSDI